MYQAFCRVIYGLSGIWWGLWWSLYGSADLSPSDLSFEEWVTYFIPFICIFFYECYPGIYKWVKQHIAQKDSDQSGGSE